jgi:hypothetical protein
VINKLVADKIASQAKNEIDVARAYKSGKIGNWSLNEAMYYGKKINTEDSRANVSLGQMQEFVHTILSKIDNPLTFKFTKRKPSQLKRVELLNSLKKYDQDRGFWDLKDIVGKKQAIIYGRSVYAYYSSSIDGYESYLEPIDVYDFLIDPSVSGIDIDTANYMGRWGVVKTKKDLELGVKKGYYHKDAVQNILLSGGNTETTNQEETNKRSRSYDQLTYGVKDVKNDNKYKFWEWFTTYNGVRYYILMDDGGQWIKCDKLSTMFSNDLFPFWSWACFPDLTEFWTPGYCDYARELFMAQEVSINQMLDNAEAINKPQKLVRVNDIEDMSKVTKYRKGGVIPVKQGVDIDKAIQFVKVPSIDTPIVVFDKLQAIQDRASGVTAGAAGVADEEGKVGIYEGNQQASADRFGLLNKSYSFGYKKFAKLYECGVKDNLIKKVAVEILGPNGVEIKMIGKRDIYKKGDEYSCIVEASDAEITNSLRNQTVKLSFLASQVNNQLVNQKKLFEMSAKISGLSEDDVRELLDVSYYGDEELMSEADRDLENLLNGEAIEPNEMANNAYKQKMVDYLKDHKEDISNKQYFEIAAYIDNLEPIIVANEARMFETAKTDAMLGTAMAMPLEQPQLPQDNSLTI